MDIRKLFLIQWVFVLLGAPGIMKPCLAMEPSQVSKSNAIRRQNTLLQLELLREEDPENKKTNVTKPLLAYSKEVQKSVFRHPGSRLEAKARQRHKRYVDNKLLRSLKKQFCKENCAICMDRLFDDKNPKQVFRVSHVEKGRSHVFHTECFEQYFTSDLHQKGIYKRECPTCRQLISHQSIEKLSLLSQGVVRIVGLLEKTLIAVNEQGLNFNKATYNALLQDLRNLESSPTGKTDEISPKAIKCLIETVINGVAHKLSRSDYKPAEVLLFKDLVVIKIRQIATHCRTLDKPWSDGLFARFIANNFDSEIMDSLSRELFIDLFKSPLELSEAELINFFLPLLNIIPDKLYAAGDDEIDEDEDIDNVHAEAAAGKLSKSFSNMLESLLAAGNEKRLQALQAEQIVYRILRFLSLLTSDEGNYINYESSERLWMLLKQAVLGWYPSLEDIDTFFYLTSIIENLSYKSGQSRELLKQLQGFICPLITTAHAQLSANPALLLLLLEAAGAVVYGLGSPAEASATYEPFRRHHQLGITLLLATKDAETHERIINALLGLRKYDLGTMYNELRMRGAFQNHTIPYDIFSRYWSNIKKIIADPTAKNLDSLWEDFGEKLMKGALSCSDFEYNLHSLTRIACFVPKSRSTIAAWLIQGYVKKPEICLEEFFWPLVHHLEIGASSQLTSLLLEDESSPLYWFIKNNSPRPLYFFNMIFSESARFPEVSRRLTQILMHNQEYLTALRTFIIYDNENMIVRVEALKFFAGLATANCNVAATCDVYDFFNNYHEGILERLSQSDSPLAEPARRIIESRSPQSLADSFFN